MRLANGLFLVLALSALNAVAETQAPEEIPAPPSPGIPQSILKAVPDNRPVAPPPPEPTPIENLQPTPAAQPTPATEPTPAPQASEVLPPPPNPMPAPSVVAPQVTSALYDTAGELPAIAQALREKRFFSDAGHSMAASILANCAPGVEAQKKADVMEAMYRAIIDRRFPVIVQSIRVLGLAPIEPQISLLAATLVCKQGERTTVQTLDALDTAFAELQAPPYSLKQFFHNLIVAANLMY